MGQQQLLLVILVVIVVGVATIVATNVISTGNVEANRDAVRQDLLSAAASVQQVYERPTIMDGAGKNFQEEFTDEKLSALIDLAGTVDGTIITNDNAIYEVSTTAPDVVFIEATPRTGGDEMTITINRNDSNEWIYTLVDGDLTVTNESIEEN